METGETPFERIRLDLAYDGTDFTGWARQPGLRTVQGVLEDALATVFRRQGDSPRLVVAGRTDVGVHATGQVAHVDLTPEQFAQLTDAGQLAKRLNGIAGLSSDVRVRRAAIAPPGFDARFGALWRRYEYRIADHPDAQDPRRRHHTLWHPAPLDERVMHEAAQSLLGLHDFAAFCRPREGATTIRTLQAFEWSRDADGVLIARLQADAFCHSMVRALVGACVGAAPEAREILDAGVRTSAFKVMPAKGLTLVEVGYPPDAELAARAEQTRGKRSLPDREPID
ncbi:MAG: tRNA pseudouridine(38-40) synthase TruA [Pseudolysinimonas sp.]